MLSVKLCKIATEIARDSLLGVDVVCQWIAHSEMKLLLFSSYLLGLAALTFAAPRGSVIVCK